MLRLCLEVSRAFEGLRIAADMGRFEEINLSDFIIGLFIIFE